MTFNELETIILTHDILGHGLNKGDTGTIVEVYNNGEAYEVEFIDAVNGRTIALLTLTSGDIRSVVDNEVFSVQDLVGSLGYSALGTADWKSPYKREFHIVGNSTITLDTESSRVESGERISYQTA